MAATPTFRIGALLRELTNELEQRVLHALHSEGFSDIHAAHAEVFGVLPPEGCRIKVLAERLRASKQAAGYLVEYLEAHDYVERIPDPTDGRATLVRRTEKGIAVNRVAGRVVQATQDDWATLVGAERMAETLDALRLIMASLGAVYEGSVAALSVEEA